MALVVDVVLKFSAILTEKVLQSNYALDTQCYESDKTTWKAQNPDQKTPHTSLTSQTIVVGQAVYSAGYVQKHRPFWQDHAYLGGVQLRSTRVTLYIECTTIRDKAANKHYRTLKYLGLLQFLTRCLDIALHPVLKSTSIMKMYCWETISWIIIFKEKTNKYDMWEISKSISLSAKTWFKNRIPSGVTFQYAPIFRNT